MSGWIKLHRTLNDNKLWLSETFTKSQAWIDLILNTNFADKILIIRGCLIHINRGQIGWSELTMAKRWRWSRSKVRRYLSYLESIHQIRQQKTSVTSVITIINYDTYQSSDTPQKTSDEHQEDINKTPDDTQHNKEKKLKNEKKLNKEITAIFDYWNLFKIVNHQKINTDIKKAIKSRLKEFSLDEIKGSISNYSKKFNNDKITNEIYLCKFSLNRFLGKGFTDYFEGVFKIKNFYDKELNKKTYNIPKQNQPQNNRIDKDKKQLSKEEMSNIITLDQFQSLKVVEELIPGIDDKINQKG